MRRGSSDDPPDRPRPFAAEQATLTKPASPTWWLHGDDGEEKESGVPEASLASGILLNETESGGVIPPLITNPSKRRKYGPPRVSEEHKREQNRITFKRFYHRKQQTMRELRQEETTLTQQYQQLTLAQSAPSRSCPAPDASYMELVTYKDHLLAQNTALTLAAQQHMKSRRALGRLVDALEGEEEASARAERAKLTVLKPTGPTGHDRIIRHAIQELDSIEMSSLERHDEAFGWSCWRQERGQALEFTFKKQLTGVQLSAVEIARRTWEFCTANDDDRSDRSDAMPAPSSSLRTHRRVVERLRSQRECVMYRVLTSARTPHRRQTQSGQPHCSALVLAKSVYVVPNDSITRLRGGLTKRGQPRRVVRWH